MFHSRVTPTTKGSWPVWRRWPPQMDTNCWGAFTLSTIFKKFLFLLRTSFTQICFSLCFHSVCPVTLRSKQRVYSGLSGSSVMCSALDRPPQTTGLICATMETRRPVARCSRSVRITLQISTDIKNVLDFHYLFICFSNVFYVWFNCFTLVPHLDFTFSIKL